jgi:hypothetical protein
MNQLTEECELDIYHESIVSSKTELLFRALTALFLFLFLWRTATVGLNALAIVFLLFTCIFMFYSVNFSTLVIHLTNKALTLRFGVFSRRVPVENIESCQLDGIPAIMRYGGAGIHFMSIRSRYRVSFNFLEYPRLVIALKQKIGLVQDVSFTTQQPDELRRLIMQTITDKPFNHSD